jgi:hypothetical protein
MAKSTKLDWNDVNMENLGENLSEDDIKNAESGGRPDVGLYLCTCDRSTLKQVNPDDGASFLAVGLGWKIDRVIELKGKKVEGNEGEHLEGRFIWDDITLPHANESDGARNRRILVAKRVGLITDTSRKIPADAWSNLIIGKQALVRVSERTYTDKSGITKTIASVPFDGYDYAAKAEQVEDADFADI